MKYLYLLTKSLSVSCLMAIILTAMADRAICQPIGDTYSLSGTNFPNTYGPVALTFDETASTAGGMNVSESFAPFAGISGGVTGINAQGIPVSFPAWKNCGNVLELSWDTISAGFIGGSAGFGTVGGYSFSDLNLASAKALFRSGAYIVVEKNNVGADYTLDPSVIDDPNSIAIGQHPLRPGTEVVFLNLSSAQLQSLFSISGNNLNGSFTTDFFGPGIGFVEIAYALGLINFSDFFGSLQKLNGLTVGLLVSPALPGDFDEDGIVGMSDLALLQANLGQPGSPLIGDMDGDGVVGRADAALFSMNYGKTRTCPAPSAPAPSAAAPGAVVVKAPSTSQISAKKKGSGVILDSRRIQREIRRAMLNASVRKNLRANR